MIYLNGDSHTAGADIIPGIAFAQDDPLYLTYAHKPHPLALQKTFGFYLAQTMNNAFYCDALSGSSNDRILRTTREFIENTQDKDTIGFVVIGWTSWEREEWKYKNDYLQVTASGTDSVPESMVEDYRTWVIKQTPENHIQKTKQWHDRIWDFHNELVDQNIKHVFFNTVSSFDTVKEQQDWHNCYFGPYDKNYTMHAWLVNQGYSTVTPQCMHFGVNAHKYFSQCIHLYCMEQLNSMDVVKTDHTKVHKKINFPNEIQVDTKFNL